MAGTTQEGPAGRSVAAGAWRAAVRRFVGDSLEGGARHDTWRAPVRLPVEAKHQLADAVARPTSASWLNQIEGFFGILTKQSLAITDFPSKRALMDHLQAYLRSWNHNPTSFEWTKPARAIIKSHKRMLDRL